MVPSDPSEWRIISSASVFRTYIFVQIESAKDHRGQSVVWNTHTHTCTHHSQISWLATMRGDTPGEPSGMCSCRRILRGPWGKTALLWTGCCLIRVQGKWRDEGLPEDQDGLVIGCPHYWECSAKHVWNTVSKKPVVIPFTPLHA